MEFGADFDDDLFGGTRDRQATKPIECYNAKICEPYWFLSNRKDGEEDMVNIYKYRADLAFYKQDYQTALENFENSKKMLPASNLTYLREVEEGMARCHLRLGNKADAEFSAQVVFDMSSNYDQITGALYLLCEIHSHFGQHQDLMESLIMLLVLHPYQPDLWVQLADSYMQLASCKAPENSRTSECGERCEFDAKKLAESASVSSAVVSGLMLHRNVQNVVTSFAKDRNEEQQQELNQRLQAMQLSTDLIKKCKKAIAENTDEANDMKMIHIPDEVKMKSLEAGREAVRSEFEKKWFSWVSAL